MVKFFATLVLLLSATLSVSAEKYEGQIDDKYDIIVNLDVNYDTGKVTGKYYYKSTIKKYGKKPSSYLYMSGTYSSDQTGQAGKIQLRVTDHKGNYVETWNGMLGIGNNVMHIDGTITMKNGKRLPVSVEYWYHYPLFP